MKNFEKGFVGNFINIDNILEKAEERLSDEKIDIEEFRDMYDDKKIEKDKAEVERLKKIFENEQGESKELKKLATIFEIIINENLELSDWMGPEAQTITTTDYDDFINGIDTLVEFNDEEKANHHMGLAIDATFSVNLEEKFEKIKNNIDKGKLATVEYFKSSDDTFKGRLSHVPRVVIGVEKNKVEELIDLWNTGKKKKLGEHPVQFHILGIVKMQLEAFLSYSKSIGDDFVSDKFNKVLNLIDKIYEEKGAEEKLDEEE